VRGISGHHRSIVVASRVVSGASAATRNAIARPDRTRQSPLDYPMETSPQRVRDHLRRSYRSQQQQLPDGQLHRNLTVPTPASASWMDLAEVWFGIIERQAIHRGSFGSVKELNAKIRAFIDGWNDRAHPFVWTKTAGQILAKANRQKTSKSRH
jgi:hypothetical protein